MNVSPAFTLGVTRLRQLRSLPRRQREIRHIVRAEATRMDQQGALHPHIPLSQRLSGRFWPRVL